MIRKTILILLILLSLGACDIFKKKSTEKPIARVFDKYLYKSDLTDILKKAKTMEDSIDLQSEFVNYWVRRELLLNKAELNLSNEDKNFQKQIEEYRASLLIYKYEEMMMNQKFDTVINEQQKFEYYNSNKATFLLNHPIAQLQYIIINNSNKDLAVIANLFAIGGEDKFDQLERSVYNNVEKFDLSAKTWQNINAFDNRITSSYTTGKNYYEFSDSVYTYLYKIRNYKAINDTAPFEYILNDIDALILNKRRILFFKNLENDLYQNAIKYNHFEIYNQ